jgi:hypothetical protein
MQACIMLPRCDDYQGMLQSLQEPQPALGTRVKSEAPKPARLSQSFSEVSPRCRPNGFVPPSPLRLDFVTYALSQMKRARKSKTTL